MVLCLAYPNSCLISDKRFTMSKQFKIYLLVFLALLSVVVILHLTNQDSTFKLSSAGFAVDDIARISEINIKSGENEIGLTKTSDGWLINKEYLAEKQLMSNFLRALSNLRVKSPVPLSEQENILDMVYDEGIEVKVKKRWRTKSFRVWYRKNNPTYMVLGNSKSPFLMEVPGLIGEVGEFFSVEEGFWRENVIFTYNINQIASVAVDYPSGHGSGFEIVIDGHNNFEVFSLPDKLPLKQFSDSLVFRYITYYSFVPYSKLLTNTEPEKLDSLSKSIPFCCIQLTDRNKKTSKLDLHLIKLDGEEEQFDPNKLYGIINQGRDIVFVKFVDVDLLMKEPGYFLKQQTEYMD